MLQDSVRVTACKALWLRPITPNRIFTIDMNAFVWHPGVPENGVWGGCGRVDNVSAIYTPLDGLAVHKLDTRVLFRQRRDEIGSRSDVSSRNSHLQDGKNA